MAVRDEEMTEEMTQRIKDAIHQSQEADIRVPPTARFKGMAMEAARRRLERSRREMLAFLAVALVLVSAVWLLLSTSTPAFLLLQGILLLAGTGFAAAIGIHGLLVARREARDRAVTSNRRS